ncbi:MAG: SpaA isopeptide-forming pilin-related protein, partial [Lachnospiraceae bacterium]|nr:SpaA isopeptide-forming pilin-related protein [Lachnospiraceae bacterium]
NSKGEESKLVEMQVKDVMDSRMDYNKEKMQMYLYDSAGNLINGVTLVEGRDYTETYDAQTHEVEWNFQPFGIQKIRDYHVAEVKIDVQMAINDSVIGTQENLWNEAYLYMQTAEGRTLSAEVFDINEDKNAVDVPKAYVGSISVYEKDEENGKLLIKGASLKLAKSKEEALAGQFIQVSGEQLHARTELLEKILPVVHAQEISSKIDFEVRTGEYGAAAFEGLGSGDYWLVEADMPEEYSENEEPIKVTVGDTQEDAHAEVILEHKKINGQKPSSQTKIDKWLTAAVKTGDHTDVCLWCGAVLIVLGAILICSRRNRKETEINEEKK